MFNPIVGRYHLSARLKQVRQVVLENSPFIVANDTTIDSADRQAIRSAMISSDSDETQPTTSKTVPPKPKTKPKQLEQHAGPVHFTVNLQEDSSSSSSEEEIPSLESVERQNSSMSIDLHPERNSFSSPEKPTPKIKSSRPIYNNWTSPEDSEEDHSYKKRIPRSRPSKSKSRDPYQSRQDRNKRDKNHTKKDKKRSSSTCRESHHKSQDRHRNRRR